MVEVENLERIENFRVTMMCEAIQEMRVAGVVIWAPEPSLLQWDLAVEDLGGWFENDVKVTDPPPRGGLGLLSQGTTWKIMLRPLKSWKLEL